MESVCFNTLKRVLLSIKVAGCFGGQMMSSCTKQRGGEGGTSGPEQQGWPGGLGRRVSKQFCRVLLRITAPGVFFYMALTTIQQAIPHSNKQKRRVEVRVDKTTANVGIIVTQI